MAFRAFVLHGFPKEMQERRDSVAWMSENVIIFFFLPIVISDSSFLNSEMHFRCVLEIMEHSVVCKSSTLFWNEWSNNISTTSQIQPSDENSDPHGWCMKHVTSTEHYADLCVFPFLLPSHSFLTEIPTSPLSRHCRGNTGFSNVGMSRLCSEARPQRLGKSHRRAAGTRMWVRPSRPIPAFAAGSLKVHWVALNAFSW